MPLLSFLSPLTTRRPHSPRYIIRAISPSLRSRRRRANAGSPFSSPHFFLTFLPDPSFSPPPSPFSLLFLSFPHLSPPLFSPPLFSPHLAPPTGRLRHRRPARFPAVHPVLNSPAPHTDSRPIWTNTSMLPAQPVQGNEQHGEGGGGDGRGGWAKGMDKGDGRRGWTERMGKRDGQRRWTKGMGEGDERRG